MIYLNAIGGISNRMRAVDSMLSLCKIHKQDLTVIWEKAHNLNCPFEELFDVPSTEGFNLHIVNTDRYQIVPRNGILKFPVLGYLPPGVKKKDKLSISAMAGFYSANDFVGKVSSIRERDRMFYTSMKPVLTPILEKSSGSSFIESCYRLCENENNYQSFRPVDDISTRIDSKTSEFNNTIGLHIRRSDHTVSALYSTTEKFIEVIRTTLEKRPEATFFVSSDSEQTKQMLVKDFGSMIISNSISNYNRNNKEAIKEAVLDLYCLSRTEKIFGSYWSTFSQVAADIGEIEEISIM